MERHKGQQGTAFVAAYVVYEKSFDNGMADTYR